MEHVIKKFRWEVILWSAIIVFAVLFSFLSIDRYLNLNAHYYDLGIMDQVVYNTSKGRILEMTNQDLQANVSRFAIHFDPILAFFSPIYLLYADPSVLLIGQAVIIALGAWAVYKIALLELQNKWQSVMFALLYLTYFPIQRMVLFEFHGVVLATTFLLYAIYCGLVRRHAAALIFIVLALLTKEHVGLVTALLGFYFVLVKKDWRLGFTIVAVSIIFFLVSVFYIIPIARQANHFAAAYFGDIGESPGRVLINLIKNPLQIFPYLLKEDTIQYLDWLFIPYGFFVVFAPLEFIILGPELLMNIVSNNSNMRSIYFQYNALIAAVVIFGAIMGFKRFQSIVPHRGIKIIIYMLFSLFLLRSWYYLSPLPLPFLHEPYKFAPISQAKRKTLYQIRDMLKDDQLIVATTPHLGPFFTQRQYYYNFLYDPAFGEMGKSEDDIIGSVHKYEKAQYVVVNIDEADRDDVKSPAYKYYMYLVNNKNYRKVLSENGIELYKRVN